MTWAWAILAYLAFTVAWMALIYLGAIRTRNPLTRLLTWVAFPVMALVMWAAWVRDRR